METERLKELFLKVKNYIANKTFYGKGICKTIRELYNDDLIDDFEYDYLISYLQKNYPTKDNDYKEFMDSPYWNSHSSADGIYFWWQVNRYDNQTNQIRINYLTKLIDNIK